MKIEETAAISEHAACTARRLDMASMRSYWTRPVLPTSGSKTASNENVPGEEGLIAGQDE